MKLVEKSLQQFEHKTPEIVFEWHDAETEAVGWVVINSLRGGAAGGGTRMRKGLNKHEVISLAKTMEVKFTVSGPAIGGAKSGINFDPNDPRKEGVLKRWYKAVRPLLKYYYGTGGDLNVDEIHEVIPITESHNIWHPQEGVLTGYFNPIEIEKINKIAQLREGVSKVIEDTTYTPDANRKYVVADMITGFGVAVAVKHYYEIYHNTTIEGKTAIIQGWGNVASAAAYYLSLWNVKVVGIIDLAGGIIDANGISFDKIKELFLEKNGNKIHHKDLKEFKEINNQIWDIPANIFIPAAASRLVNQDQIDRLISNGLEVISSGANVPFKDEEIFFGPIAANTDKRVSILPDFIANCGMARVFAYLMEKDADLSDKAIFEDTSSIIYKALEKTYKQNASTTNIYEEALQSALKELI